MPMLTAQQAAQKWKTNLQGSTAAIEMGVNNVNESPMDKAIAQKDKMITNWNNAISSGKWERGLQAVTLAEWKQKMISVGIQRIQQGANAGMTKYQAYYAAVQPYMEQGLAQINQMPTTTFADRVQKAVAWMTHMHDFEYNG